MTSEEKWNGDKVDLSHPCIFGCKVCAHIPDEKRKTLDVKSKMLTFVRYCEGSKNRRLLDLQHPGKIVRAIDVIFLEAELMNNSEAMDDPASINPVPVNQPLLLDTDKQVPEYESENESDRVDTHSLEQKAEVNRRKCEVNR
jgi:hypothetical protein